MSDSYTVTITNQEGGSFVVDADRPLLETLEERGVDLPYGCRYGGCITCAAKLIDGVVDQHEQVALNNRQITNGYIVLCVARPRSDCTLAVGVESHDKLYRNPFLDPLAPHELKPDIAEPLDSASARAPTIVGPASQESRPARGTSMLEVGTAAPQWTASNQDGEDLSLSDLAGKWVAMWWYPKASTPG